MNTPLKSDSETTSCSSVGTAPAGCALDGTSALSDAAIDAIAGGPDLPRDLTGAFDHRAFARAIISAAASPGSVALGDEDKQILEAVWREMDEGDGVNAPGHAHETPGVWDMDNGEKSGKPCAWCLTWKKFTAIARATRSAA